MRIEIINYNHKCLRKAFCRHKSWFKQYSDLKSLSSQLTISDVLLQNSVESSSMEDPENGLLVFFILEM